MDKEEVFDGGERETRIHKKNWKNGTDFADDMKTKQQNDPNGDGMKIKQSDYYVPTT